MDMFDEIALQQEPQDPVRPVVQQSPAPRTPEEADLFAQWQREGEQKEKQFMASYRIAMRDDPNMVAEARRIAAKLNIAPEVAESDINVAREMAKQQALAMQLDAGKYPTLTRQMQDMQFLRIAHDDLDNLATTESTMGTLGEFYASGQRQDERGLIAFKVMTGTADQEEIDRLYEIDVLESEMPKRAGGFTGGSAEIIGQMSRVVPTALGAGVAAAGVASVGGPVSSSAAFTWTMVATTFGMQSPSSIGNAYWSLVQQGVDHEVAKQSAIPSGLGDAALEAWAGKLASIPFKGAAKKILASSASRALQGAAAGGGKWTTFVKDYLKALGAEVGTEMAQETQQALWENLALSRSGMPTQSLSDIAGRNIDVAEKVVTGMALLALPGPGLKLIADAHSERAGKVRDSIVQQMSEEFSASKLGVRDPETHTAVVQRMADDSGVSSVYVNGNDADNVLRAMGSSPDGPQGVNIDPDLVTDAALIDIDRVAPGFAVKIREAIASGGTVEIPTGMWARISETDAGKALASVLTFDPSQTIQATETYKAELAGNLKALDEIAAVDKQFRDDAKAVRADIKKQLVAARPDEVTDEQIAAAAAPVGNWFDVQARRWNETPEEAQRVFGKQVVTAKDVYAKFPLRIEAGVGGDLQAQSGGKQTGAYRLGQWAFGLDEKATLADVTHETAHFWTDATLTIAADANAPSWAKQDADALFEFWGLKDLAEWNALDTNEKAKRYEQIAYNAPIYWATGKAPSSKLAKLFRNMGRWLIALWRDIRGEMNTNYRAELKERGMEQQDLPVLTSELAAWFDRMLASEDAIGRALDAQGVAGTFAVRPEGVSDQDWQRLQDLASESRALAAQELGEKSLRATELLKSRIDRVEKTVRAEANRIRAGVRAEVAKEVEARPIRRAEKFLRTGKVRQEDGTVLDAVKGEPHRMSREVAEAMIPKDAKNAADLEGMVAKEGLHPDDVADSVGIKEGGAAMIRMLLESKPIEEEIDAITDTRVEQQFGELTSEEAIREAVAAAVHNDLRQEMVALELKALRGSGNVAEIKRAAKVAADQQMERTLVRDVKAKTFDAAAVRARRAAEDASAGKKGRTSEDAIRFKQQELLQSQMARSAATVRKDIDKKVKALKSLFRSVKDVSKTRNYELARAAAAMAGMFGLGTKSPRMAQDAIEAVSAIKVYAPELGAQIEAKVEQARIAAAKVADRANRMPVGGVVRADKPLYQDMTVEEFRNLTDLIESTWQESKRVQDVKLGDARLETATAVATLIDQAEKGKKIKATPYGKRKPTDKEMEAVSRMGLVANSTRAEHFFRWLDGGKDGAWTKLVFRPMQEAVTRYRQRWAPLTERFTQLLAALPKHAGKIEATRDGEIGHTFGTIFELMHAILHSGSELGRYNMLAASREGHSWGDVDMDGNLDTSRWDKTIDRLIQEGVLTKEHFEFVENVYALFDEVRPSYFAAWREVFGFPPTPVEEVKIVNRLGTFRGGYVPYKLDRSLSQQAETRDVQSEILRNAQLQGAKIRSGAGISRVKHANAPDLDLRRIPDHFSEALRFAEIQPLLKDLLKVFQSAEMQDAMRKIDPNMWTRIVMPWLNRSANQITSEPGKVPVFDKYARILIRRTGLNRMVGSLSNIFQQPTGIAATIAEVGPGPVASAFVHAAQEGYGKLASTIAGLSRYMDVRFKNQLFDIAADMDRAIGDKNWLQRMEKAVQQKGYKPQAFVQNIVDTVSWWASYSKSIAELTGAGMSEAKAQKEAVARADSVVRRTQGSLEPESRSTYESGTAAQLLFTQFQSFFVAQANLQYYGTRSLVDEMGWKGASPKIASLLFWGVMVQFALGQAIQSWVSGRLTSDEDEDGIHDLWFEAFVAAPSKAAVGAVPFVGPIGVALMNKFNDKPFDDRLGNAPALSAIESGIVGIHALVTGKEATGRDIRGWADFGAIFTGLPLSVPAKPFIWWADAEEPQGIYDTVRGVLTGTASPESRR